MDQRSIVLYLHLKELSAHTIHDDLVAALGPKAVAYSRVTRYLREAKLGTAEVTLSPEQSSPHLDDSDRAILAVLEEKESRFRPCENLPRTPPAQPTRPRSSRPPGRRKLDDDVVQPPPADKQTSPAKPEDCGRAREGADRGNRRHRYECPVVHREIIRRVNQSFLEKSHGPGLSAGAMISCTSLGIRLTKDLEKSFLSLSL
jgi:hypothetical protein